MFEKYLTKTGRLSPNQPPEIKTQYYVEKFKVIHSTLYDYSLVEYLTAKSEVNIICAKHGIFKQTPTHHLQGTGCPSCYSDRKVSNTEDFIIKQTQVYGTLYDYSKVFYVLAKEKVEIICKEHGSFLQAPNSHLKGSGCPLCIKHSIPNRLYVLKCRETNLIKIGITSDINRRLREIGLEYCSTLFYSDIDSTTSIRELEKFLHQKLQHNRVTNLQAKSGCTEFFQISSIQEEKLLAFLFLRETLSSSERGLYQNTFDI